MNYLRLTIVALLLAGLLYLGYGHFFPNNDRQIHKMLDKMAVAACIPDKIKPVSMVMALTRIQDSFTPDVRVSVSIPGAGSYSFEDRDTLMMAVKGAFSNYRNVSVQFLDVNLKIDPSQQTATGDMTLKATQPNRRDFFFQELKMQFVKKDNDWLVSRIDQVDALKK